MGLPLPIFFATRLDEVCWNLCHVIDLSLRLDILADHSGGRCILRDHRSNWRQMTKTLNMAQPTVTLNRSAVA